ncbi:hypothetical protein KGQ71_01035 [Patescibacteria group bacterium]|nr:hypothetical protein [Patescibacteria group bacterium]
MDNFQTDQYGHIIAPTGGNNSSGLLRILQKISFHLIKTEGQATAVVIVVFILALAVMAAQIASVIRHTEVTTGSPPPLPPVPSAHVR